MHLAVRLQITGSKSQRARRARSTGKGICEWVDMVDRLAGEILVGDSHHLETAVLVASHVRSRGGGYILLRANISY